MRRNKNTSLNRILNDKGQIECKTVGFFFLKIGKEIGKAWRKSLEREARERKASLPSLALCFQPRSRPFV